MTEHERDLLLLAAYGELDEVDEKRFEALLANPNARAEYESLVQLSQNSAAAPEPPECQFTTEHLRIAILSNAVKPSRKDAWVLQPAVAVLGGGQEKPRGGWVWTLFPALGALACLAVIAAVLSTPVPTVDDSRAAAPAGTRIARLEPTTPPAQPAFELAPAPTPIVKPQARRKQTRAPSAPRFTPSTRPRTSAPPPPALTMVAKAASESLVLAAAEPGPIHEATALSMAADVSAMPERELVVVSERNSLVTGAQVAMEVSHPGDVVIGG